MAEKKIQLTDEDQYFLKLINDPVFWAEATLHDPRPGHADKPLHLREYQKEVLRDQSLRKACRMGRRIGKTTTMVIHILWYAFTHEDSRQLISTPYDNQIQVIFDMILSFFNNTPGLSGSIKEKTKTPARIKLTNNAIISGFTAGTKSGSKGGSMRGQAADWIYLDEVDYMDDAAFQAITAVAIERPDIGIWVSSTPTGRRGMFWKICSGKITRTIYDKDDVAVGTESVWKEFYHPSMDNPSWNKAMEEEFRGMYDEETYKHEVCLTPGQNIITDSGLVKIEDIKIGDMVLTHENRYMPVVNLFKRFVEEEIYEIVTENGTFSCTHNHPIYVLGKTKAKWVRAEKLTPNDIIICNKDSNENLTSYKNYRLAPIVLINKILYDGDVYNIEVKEDNSYSVEGKIVHNCAEFGEETIGVFKKELVDLAKKSYSYQDYQKNPADPSKGAKQGYRILGVDWDKYANASQAVIIEYNKAKKKFVVIKRHETPKSEFTLTNAVNRIIELNEEYNLDYIYVDRGFGEFQVETLHKYGMSHPETGLTQKVFGISFAETKEVRDPATKQMSSMPIKPFMVNQLVNVFEAKRIDISSYDEMIIRQLENYQVVKKTVSGSPVYTSSDEHALDCMMLSIFGFVERYPAVISDVLVFKHDSMVAKIKVNPNKKENEIDKMYDDMIDKIKDKYDLKPKSNQVGPRKVTMTTSGFFKRKSW